MMDNTHAIVVTTINKPTQAVVDLRDGAISRGVHFILIGDRKSPVDFELSGADYLNIDKQIKTGFQFAKVCPTGHYARKNIGYLVAIKNGAKVIVETDDDNLPLDNFWLSRTREITAPTQGGEGWHNVYKHFSDSNIWPRGLPLSRIMDKVEDFNFLPTTSADCPIQQGLADENPDVDAIYRLTSPLPINFIPNRQVILESGVWCPFNSQNTSWWSSAFPLLYLPYFCSFRMTDIWRSFVAQRIAWENGWKLMFHSSTMWQDRNEHDLMRDFSQEVVGYLRNEEICKTLKDLSLKGGVSNQLDDLIKCYDALIGLEVVGKEEMALLNAWAEDISGISG